MANLTRTARQERRRQRVRSKIAGTAARPRLSVSRSNKHIRAQLVDDVAARTLLEVSSLSPALRAQLRSGANKAAARAVGRLFGERAKAQGFTRVVFDRGGHVYHGRVKELAEGAREAGLQF